MNQNERRKRLFWNGKPNIRLFEANDYGWLWAAYQTDEVTKEQFIVNTNQILSRYNEVYIVDDRNKKFEDSFGSVALVCAYYDGHRLEPHVEWFPWATPKNKLRSHVAFLQKMKYRKDVAVTEVKSSEGNKKFFHNLSKYISLKSCGMLPKGRADGNEHRFFIFGKKR